MKHTAIFTPLFAKSTLAILCLSLMGFRTEAAPVPSARISNTISYQPVTQTQNSYNNTPINNTTNHNTTVNDTPSLNTARYQSSSSPYIQMYLNELNQSAQNRHAQNNQPTPHNNHNTQTSTAQMSGIEQNATTITPSNNTDSNTLVRPAFTASHISPNQLNISNYQAEIVQLPTPSVNQQPPAQILTAATTLPDNTNSPIQNPIQTQNNALFNTPTPTQALPYSNATTIPQTHLPQTHFLLPNIDIQNVQFIPTIIIPSTQHGLEKIDASLIDDLLTSAAPHARHYPPTFANRTQRYNTVQKVKTFSKWIEPYAEAPDASFDVLLRAAKINGMGKNLDLGSDYTTRGTNYIAKALLINPNHAEANFLYGIMLAEGGGFKEGKKYLDKAASLGYVEAEQSLAQSDLLQDNREAALQRLQALAQRFPNNQQITQQIQIIEQGGYYIWKLPTH